MQNIFKLTVTFLLLICLGLTGFTQPVRQNPIPKNWLEKDPLSDSLAGISLDKAYQLLKGRTSHTVIVAVIDNGVDIQHEDLKNVIWTNEKEIPDNGLDDDNNGYVDDIHGWNFRGTKDGTIVENEQAASTQYWLAWKNRFENINNTLYINKDDGYYSTYLKAKRNYLDKLQSRDSMDIQFLYNVNYHSSQFIFNDTAYSNPYYGSPYMKLSPNLSHGTHVSGIIAAQRNNHIGMDGIADNVLIMPIAATTAGGDERDKDIANAIRYAVNNGARIINMSFSKVFSPDKSVVDEAIRYAGKKNVLIIHAAGNDGVNID